MKVLRVLDSSGDTAVQFDSNTRAEKKARELFARLTQAGAVAFKVNRIAGLPDAKVVDFCEIENETVIVPRVVGG